MHVVERNVNDMFDLAAWRIQVTRRVRADGCGGGEDSSKRERKYGLQSIYRSLLWSSAFIPTNCEIATDGANRALMLLRGNDGAVTTHKRHRGITDALAQRFEEDNAPCRLQRVTSQIKRGG